jgi:hypothetical protein
LCRSTRAASQVHKLNDRKRLRLEWIDIDIA